MRGWCGVEWETHHTPTRPHQRHQHGQPAQEPPNPLSELPHADGHLRGQETQEEQQVFLRGTHPSQEHPMSRLLLSTTESQEGCVASAGGIAGMGGTRILLRSRAGTGRFRKRRQEASGASNSAGECYLHTVEVEGSIPSSPTTSVQGSTPCPATRPHSSAAEQQAVNLFVEGSSPSVVATKPAFSLSSAAEQLAVNQCVPGSSPSPATKRRDPRQLKANGGRSRTRKGIPTRRRASRRRCRPPRQHRRPTNRQERSWTGGPHRTRCGEGFRRRCDGCCR